MFELITDIPSQIPSAEVISHSHSDAKLKGFGAVHHKINCKNRY